MGLPRACGGATGRVVQGIAASMKGTAFTKIYVDVGLPKILKKLDAREGV